MIVWGRSFEHARALAERMEGELSLPSDAAESAQEAAANADVICTVTSAFEPILHGDWVNKGAHVNLVGSSYAGPAEADNSLVARARFFVDSREGVLNQGAEFLRAKRAGLIGDDHILGEIGQVLAGAVEGRRSEDEITIYKSLGHIVQDLASAWAVYGGARE
jgi:ornithine cyclodeaminase